MKKYILLFLLTLQMVFSQEIVIKGKAFNSKKHKYRHVDIVLNDTINKLRKHNDSLYENWEKNSYDRNDKLYLEYDKNYELINQLYKDRNYSTKTDSLGNFEIKAKLSDTLSFQSYWHSSKKYMVADLLKKENINIELELEPCEVWPSHPENPTKLYVFVGKKIKTWDSPSSHCNDSFYDRTIGEYEIVKDIYGNYNKKNIQFTSYTHEFMVIDFYNFEYCLLYILEFKGEFIKVRHLFDGVFMTKEGRWATPLMNTASLGSLNPNEFAPTKIDFLAPFELENNMEFKNIRTNYFYDEYSIKKDSTVEVTHGYYIEDLFEIRKVGRLLKEFEYLLNE